MASPQKSFLQTALMDFSQTKIVDEIIAYLSCALYGLGHPGPNKIRTHMIALALSKLIPYCRFIPSSTYCRTDSGPADQPSTGLKAPLTNADISSSLSLATFTRGPKSSPIPAL